MKGYITQEEQQRMQQMSASTDIKRPPVFLQELVL